MDPKKLEIRLCEWSRQLGFTLPDGTFPQPNFFSQLVSTPNTLYLWAKLLNIVEPRDKIRKIRKQILVAKLKSDEKEEHQQNPILNVHQAGIQRKVELWKKKKAMEKMIAEKKEQVDQLRDEIYKKAQLIQSGSCKLAEIEKHHSDLKEKLLISLLLIDRHKSDIENYKAQISKIKSYKRENALNSVNGFEKNLLERGMKKLESTTLENWDKNSFDLGEEVTNELNDYITDKNSVTKLWNLLIDLKVNNFKENSSAIESHASEEGNSKGAEGDRVSWTSQKEKFMLDITENSLQAISNRRHQKAQILKLRQITTNIEKLMFNNSIPSSSQVELSYLQPNETGDSLTGRKEKMSMFMKALTNCGLKKRYEFLKREAEKIERENKKREHWSVEKEKYEEKAKLGWNKLESIMKEAIETMSVQKSQVQAVLKNHSELVHVVNGIKNDLNAKKTFEMLTKSVTEIKKGNENQIELVGDMCLEAFRRIHIAPGKEVYEFESLQHCLDHYGGELRNLFSTLLVSPYEKPEAIISKLEERKKFLSHVKELIPQIENDSIDCEARFAKGCNVNVDPEAIEKNQKEILRVLSQISTRQEVLKTESDLVRSIVKNWLKQPYRLMIPSSMTVNSMTLRQYEEKYRTVQSEIKYCTELNQSVVFKG